MDSIQRHRDLVFDAERRSWDGLGARPISWAAWHPVTHPDAETESVAEPLSLPRPRPGAAVAEGALPDDGRRYPVVLLSHGTGGSALGLGWLGRRLAQQGYIVLGANHHGNTHIEPYLAEDFLCWWERARDLSVLLDQAGSISGFEDRLDLDRVYAAGFSLGGHTVASLLGAVTELVRFQAWASAHAMGRGPRELPDLADHVPMLLKKGGEFARSHARQSHSYRDARIRAALLCAPGPPVRSFTDDSLRSVRTPVRIFVGDRDVEAPAAECAVWLHRHLAASRLDMLGPEAGHYVFLPEGTEEERRLAPDLWVDPPGVDRGSIHEHVAKEAVDLFETT